MTVIIVVSIILTTSRAAYGGLVISIPFLIGLRSFVWLIPILILLILLILATINPIFGESTQVFLKTYIPQNIWEEFSQIEFANQPLSRLDIWIHAIETIKNNLFFGTGSRSFPYLLKDSGSYGFYWHTHNLPIEIALSYGLPVALIIISLVTKLTFLTFKNIYLSKKYSVRILSERAWITSLIIIIISQLVDIQYFDGRISITSWIFLAGMRCMLRENEENERK